MIDRFTLKGYVDGVLLCDGKNKLPDIPFNNIEVADIFCSLLNEAEKIKSDFRVVELKNVLELFKENDISLTSDVVKQALESVYHKQ